VRAIVCTRYGPLEALRVEETPKPSPLDHEVLVEIHAASINHSVLFFVKGESLAGRMGFGLLNPRYRTPGNDIAGRVEAVGKNVTQFKPGDDVYGDLAECGWGAFAEHACVPAAALSRKPANLTFEEAAAVPEAAVVALQGLRDKGKIKAGHKVLVHGASGGVGTFAVQIAKAFGAEVTGLCSTRNVELVRSLGADHVIDYNREDFAQSGQRYDLILATAGSRSILDYRRALTPTGIHVATGGAMAQIFQPLLLGPWLTMLGRKRMCTLAMRPNTRDLELITGLIETGKVRPVIEKCYPLTQSAEAVSHYGQGHTRGKIVLRMKHQQPLRAAQAQPTENA